MSPHAPHTLGLKLKEQRRRLGLTQSSLAEQAGISTSYLNLIENGKRSIGGALLQRLAERLELPLNQLSGAHEARLAQDVEAALRQHGSLELDPATLSALTAQAPQAGRALVQLGRALSRADSRLESYALRFANDTALHDLVHELLSSVTAVRAFAEILRDTHDLTEAQQARYSAVVAEEAERLTQSAQALTHILAPTALATGFQVSPQAEVEDFFIDQRNFFPRLEDAAQSLSLSALKVGQNRFAQLKAQALTEEHSLLEAAVEEANLSSDEAKTRACKALAAYMAAARLMPYTEFHAAAEAQRYDIDALCQTFGVSFEQACHRLVTLRKLGAEGVPFAFMRAHPTGHVSKRFSLPGLNVPGVGESCPLWVVHQAISQPEQLSVHKGLMPNGRSFIFIARASYGQAAAWPQPRPLRSVMLATDAANASRLAYADGLREAAPLPVGPGCRACPREACASRLVPQVEGLA